MKRYPVTFCVLLIVATVSALAWSGVFGYVKAVPDGEDIVVEWRTTSESGIRTFDIERKSEDLPDFRRLTSISAKGSAATYKYVDRGAFFKPQGGKVFTYRLKAVTPTGELYSPPIAVVHNVSSVKRSWGMIKELFR